MGRTIKITVEQRRKLGNFFEIYKTKADRKFIQDILRTGGYWPEVFKPSAECRTAVDVVLAEKNEQPTAEPEKN